MKGLLISLIIAMFALSPAESRGTMTIRSYSAARNNRFYTGSDKNFIGAAYNFSGVGQFSAGHWGTLLSDNYFITATHYAPAIGETVTFYATNSKSGQHYTYSVAAGTRVGTTDIWIGRLNTAVDSSIARYPILELPKQSDYLGRVLYNYGSQDIVGRNVVDTIREGSYGGSTNLIAWYDYDNNDTPSVGGDETLLQVGDSGAPSFVATGSGLALVGIHWVSDLYIQSGDSFIPPYANDINTILKQSGQALSVVPEPSGHWYALIIACALWLMRRRANSQ
ncbi:MAG: hypothetical protein HGB06_02570 [Chlorobaculum sp.]|nr:hypothetical protein [Chlorobaculum sp.]